MTRFLVEPQPDSALFQRTVEAMAYVELECSRVAAVSARPSHAPREQQPGEEHRRRPPRVRCDPQYPRGRLHGRYSASALIGRLMSERTASLALRCWYSTR